MALIMESCSKEEVCASLGASEKLLNELRDGLRDWLKLQPHLPQDAPKELLESLILGSKMNLEQAKQKLDIYYTIRRAVPELFADRDPRGFSLTDIHTTMQIAYLPKLTPEKYRVCVIRPYGHDYSNLGGFDLTKYVLMIEDILLNDPESHSLGSVFIYDQSMLTLDLIAKYTPEVIKKSEVALTEAYATRVKAVHFVNASSVTETLVTLIKKVVKPKLAARIHAHSKGNYESLHQYVPKSILPKDYDGKEPSVSHLAELLRQKVDEKRDWFLEQEKILVDERLRPGPAFDDAALFGLFGSLQQLEVD